MFKNLSVDGSKSGLLSVVTAHSDQFVPTSPKADFPQPLTSLTGSKYMEMKYCELFEESESVYLSITEKMAEHVEAATRDQSNSKL